MKRDEPSVLKEADGLINGDRNSDYGHPLDDFTVAMDILNALGFRRQQGHGGPFRPLVAEDQPIIMQAVKLSREYNKPKRDNRVDGAGYWGTLQMVEDERARREAVPVDFADEDHRAA